MKAFLEFEGLECKSPRSAIKEGFSLGLIENGDNWIDMMQDRNRTSHIYDENEAREIFEKIKDHHKEQFEKLLTVMKDMIKEIDI
ncbi:MAG: HI0074 family nucleotidyltransferase substrate-binding subunit [Spirochaetota bacterium]|nr:HI0074 family nucleotidyltransferase substrate-binding subunit [Spirochaetota bacterium]